jgi:predicted signal transduction protein with EAL and GGDEF domain
VLTLEITETTLMCDFEQASQRLTALKRLGVRVAIDDFGTGYCSLAHLQRFPVDELKIDQSFIARLKDNPEGEALLHTLVQLGKALSIETLAEGIEKPQQLALLQGERCDSGQGFLFARPLEKAAADVAGPMPKSVSLIRGDDTTHHVPADQALARTLRRLRRETGSTQEDIAYEAGITVGALARIERGQANPRWTTVGRIIGALGVGLSELAVEVEEARGGEAKHALR